MVFPTEYITKNIDPLWASIYSDLGKNGVNKYLVTVDSIHLREVSLFFLEQLMGTKGWHTIYISVDQPSNYLLKLLKVHNLNTTNLRIIDVITGLTTEKPVCNPMVIQLRSPFCQDLDKDLLDALSKPMSEIKDTGRPQILLLMFDNIAVLDHYIELIDMKRIFVKIDEFLKNYPFLKTVILMDVKRHPRVFTAFETWADMQLPI